MSKKKTPDEIADKIESMDLSKQQNQAAVASVLSRAKDDTTAKQSAAQTAIKKSLQANPTPVRTDRNKYIRPELMEYIRQALKFQGKTGKDWIYRYVDKVMATAMKDPESKSGMLFSNFIFDKENFLEHLDELVSRAEEKDTEYIKYLIRSTLYDKQQEVYDNNIDKRFLIVNSRRTGKTELMGRIAVRSLLLPDAHVVYINRNAAAAIRQIKRPFETALAKSGLTVTKGSIEGQEIHFSNGAQMLVLGNNNAADIDKLRGERISCCIMDECAHQRNVRQLMREVIGPALKDYGKEAKLYLVGTPPRNKGTYVEEVWNNAIERGWKTYHWTFMENPFIPDRNSVIDEVCKENGCTPDSAFIRREYFGEMNAYDTDALWIKRYSYNPQERIPTKPLYAYIGVDWGYEDKAAVVSVVADQQTGRAYIVDSWSEEHKGITEVSKEVERQVESLKQHYELIRDPWIICDNNEKGAVADLSLVYHIPHVFTAYKYDLDFAEDQLNELFSTNKIMIVNDPSERVREDCDNSMWQRDEETDVLIHQLDDDIWHPNALMAILYVTRQFAYEILGWIDKNKAAKEIING